MNFNHFIILAIKGVAMGAADLIPGISGGTVALITGIYENLIKSLNKIISSKRKITNLPHILKSSEFTFLLNLFLGIICGVLAFSRLIEFLFNTYEILTWSFISGLIISAIILLIWRIKSWNINNVLFIFLGIILGQIVVSVPNLDTTHNIYIIFLSGFFAISAMLLPGISGSYILVLLGQYAYIITSLNNFNLSVISTFILGAVLGLIVFTKIVSAVMKRWNKNTIILMTGLIIGSLTKLWPWKNNNNENISPMTWENSTNNDPQLYAAIIFFISAVLLGLLISYLSLKLSPKVFR
ncbi:MAG: DUF368 domain-containing protein [Dehalococcoidia bacterium]|tara:strand:+ start:114 stop:1004 length:891 start_codon:yes stop_codon:yes gene_type:complete